MHTLLERKFTMLETQHALENLQDNQAAGPDRVCNEYHKSALVLDCICRASECRGSAHFAKWAYL